MHICITGGTGFIGRALQRHLVTAGHNLTIISRTPHPAAPDHTVTYLIADPAAAGGWQRKLADHDAVINLAGSSIFHPWTTHNQRKMVESRLHTTSNIADALIKRPGRCKVLISASAVGYYGFEDKGDIILEDHPPGDHFLAELAKRWEDEAIRAEKAGVRVARCRFAVVLGLGGGALTTMLPAFRLALGSALGTGKQPFPWIQLDDLCRAILFILENENLNGPFNFAAPQSLTNHQFSEELSRALNRPMWLPNLPTWLLTLVLGEMATLVLHGQNVAPARLLESGFHFSYPDIQPALAAILKKVS